MPLAAAERGGHSLHPHTARLSLPLSLSISRPACLSRSASPSDTFPPAPRRCLALFSPLPMIFFVGFGYLFITVLGNYYNLSTIFLNAHYCSRLKALEIIPMLVGCYVPIHLKLLNKCMKDRAHVSDKHVADKQSLRYDPSDAS